MSHQDIIIIVATLTFASTFGVYASRFTLVSKGSDDLFSNYPRIILSNEFMVNKYSDPVIISTLLSKELENLYNMVDGEYNENHYIIIQYTLLTASR